MRVFRLFVVWVLCISIVIGPTATAKSSSSNKALIIGGIVLGAAALLLLMQIKSGKKCNTPLTPEEKKTIAESPAAARTEFKRAEIQGAGIGTADEEAQKRAAEMRKFGKDDAVSPPPAAALAPLPAIPKPSPAVGAVAPGEVQDSGPLFYNANGQASNSFPTPPMVEPAAAPKSAMGDESKNINDQKTPTPEDWHNEWSDFLNHFDKTQPRHCSFLTIQKVKDDCIAVLKLSSEMADNIPEKEAEINEKLANPPIIAIKVNDTRSVAQPLANADIQAKTAEQLQEELLKYYRSNLIDLGNALKKFQKSIKKYYIDVVNVTSEKITLQPVGSIQDFKSDQETWFPIAARGNPAIMNRFIFKNPASATEEQKKVVQDRYAVLLNKRKTMEYYHALTLFKVGDAVWYKIDEFWNTAEAGKLTATTLDGTLKDQIKILHNSNYDLVPAAEALSQS